MTAKEIYLQALSALEQQFGDDPDRDEAAPNLINTLLPESLPAENARRVWKGVDPLQEVPVIESLSQTIPYISDAANLLVPGLIGLLWQLADEEYKAARWTELYRRLLNECTPLPPEVIQNRYE